MANNAATLHIDFITVYVVKPVPFLQKKDE